jgi:hypothetical protein
MACETTIVRRYSANWPSEIADEKIMKRCQLIVLTVLIILGMAVPTGYHLGTRLLHGKILESLGPSSRLADIRVNWFSIELLGLSIDAPKGWPTARTLEAERVTIVPDLRSLVTDRIRIASIVVEKPYLSMLRAPGKLVMVPSLTEPEGNKRQEDAAHAVLISTIELKDGTVDLYDATVRRPPLRTRLEDINAVIRDVTAPATGKTRFELAGIVKGVKRDGAAKLSGWVGPGARDSWSHLTLNGVDLVALQAYFVRNNEARVSKGTLDLNLDSTVRNNNLDGKGTVVLKGLVFAPSTGFLDTFMGLPRNAVISFLKDNNDAIDVDFVIKGNTNQPNFSLNESLSTRIATAMAGELGVNIKSVAEGIGTLGRKGLEEAGSVVEGITASIKGLFSSNQSK